MRRIVEEYERKERTFSRIVGPNYLFECVTNGGVELFLMGEDHHIFSEETIIRAEDVINIVGNEVLIKGKDDTVTIARFLYAWFLRIEENTDFFLESMFGKTYPLGALTMVERIHNLFNECFAADKDGCFFNPKVHFHATDYRGSPKRRYFTLLHFLELMTYPTIEFENLFPDISRYDDIIFTADFDKMIRLIYEPFINEYGSAWMKELMRLHYTEDNFKAVLVRYAEHLHRIDDSVIQLIEMYPDEDIRLFIATVYRLFSKRVQGEADDVYVKGLLKTGTTWTKVRHQLKRLDRINDHYSDTIVEFIKDNTPSVWFPVYSDLDMYRGYKKAELVVEAVTVIMDVATLARMMYAIYSPDRLSKRIIFFGGPFHTNLYVKFFKSWFFIDGFTEIKSRRKNRADMSDQVQMLEYDGIMEKMNN